MDVKQKRLLCFFVECAEFDWSELGEATKLVTYQPAIQISGDHTGPDGSRESGLVLHHRLCFCAGLIFAAESVHHAGMHTCSVLGLGFSPLPKD